MFEFIRNPFAFCFPIQRGFSGAIQTLAMYKTHCEPLQTLILSTWGYGETLEDTCNSFSHYKPCSSTNRPHLLRRKRSDDNDICNSV